MTRKPLLAFFGGVLATAAVVFTFLLLIDGPKTNGFGQMAYAQQAQKPT